MKIIPRKVELVDLEEEVKGRNLTRIAYSVTIVANGFILLMNATTTRGILEEMRQNWLKKRKTQMKLF